MLLNQLSKKKTNLKNETFVRLALRSGKSFLVLSTLISFEKIVNSSKSGDRKILGLNGSLKYQGPLSGGPETKAWSTGVSVDMGRVKVSSGVISPLVGNYTEDFKTRFSHAQKLGYIKLIYVIRRKP
jgi:hypothetical protein